MERAPQSRKRHPLEATYRSTVEGLALLLRPLADLLRPLRALEEGWHLGSAACPRPNQSGRGGRGRHGRPRSPARCESTHKAESQRSKNGLGHSLEEALGRSRGAFLPRSISPAMAKAGHFQWFSRPDKGTQAPNLEVCSMAFGYHVLRV